MLRLRAAGGLPQPELPQELDVGGGLELVGDPGEVVGVEGRQLALVVDEGVVDRAEPLACRHRLHLALRLDVLPEGDDVAVVTVGAGIEQIGRLDDRRAGTGRV